MGLPGLMLPFLYLDQLVSRQVFLLAPADWISFSLFMFKSSYGSSSSDEMSSSFAIRYMLSSVRRYILLSIGEKVA
jgi:hypothetical protein